MNTESEPVRPVSVEGGEAGALAREAHAAFGEMVQIYKQLYKCSTQEAVARAEARDPSADGERILRGPPDQIAWFDLHQLADRDPQLAARRWEEIKAAALGELRCGHAAARAVEPWPGGSAWQRARFLALREELSEGWQPRTGVERVLLDTLAQAQSAMLEWLETLTLRTNMASMDSRASQKEMAKWTPPRLSDFEAVEQAAEMVDRFNRIFLRTLRALRDLRRYGPAVVVQNAGQVNVGGQQVNVAAGGRREEAT